MRSFCFTTIIVALLLSIFGCNSSKSDQLTELQKETILQSVKEASQRIWDLQESYDSASLQNFMDLVDPESDRLWQTDPAAMVYNLNIIKTRADLNDAWGKSVESRTGTPVNLLEDYFAVISQDLVLEVNKADYSVMGKDSTTYGPFSMVNTTVWINRNGDWKMLHSHSSWAKKKVQ
jgi:ketosteroid isomerase-like protein